VAPPKSKEIVMCMSTLELMLVGWVASSASFIFGWMIRSALNGDPDE
jgi:hypothetical protein